LDDVNIKLFSSLENRVLLTGFSFRMEGKKSFLVHVNWRTQGVLSLITPPNLWMDDYKTYLYTHTHTDTRTELIELSSIYPLH
jgi:hypothetical protein